ncbi:MAG TPA: preprotein translocase subunit YajC [Actinophytocola sp.]|uniref:preprotein translocase subunit YajC n=1 Tax=Actinophytocola sp. TaxID=1872138 RepID=UPI002DDCB797|nr:preprotein translocase subunit YajC [Actinophytocola sp.]HEV2781308.1 preprotein translocase subunit YajC [Actinophytocola sp.]
MELLPMLLLFGLLGLMMYFMSRRQRRAVQQQQELQNSLEVGDRVMTTSGLYGTITATYDTTVDLEIAPGVETNWLRAAVREKVTEVEDEVSDEVEEYETVDEPAEVEAEVDTTTDSKSKTK